MKTKPVALCLLASVSMLMADGVHFLSPPPPVQVLNNQLLKSKPLPRLAPVKSNLPRVSALATGSKSSLPRDMKLLVITANVTDPSCVAIQYFLDHIGVPYDVVAAVTQDLPALDNGTKGFYQGIIMASGNPAICDAKGACVSALSDAEWTALDTYTRDYGIRTVSYYTWPEARYGLSYVSSLSTEATAASLNFAAASASVFPYLKRSAVPIRYAYTYLANPVQAEGETTTPILTVNGLTTGVIHQKPDGREYIALTFDNNPFLVHSLALNYGLINWVTNGMFIGARKVYMNPQIDDYFLPNDQYSASIPGCKPTGFILDPTVDPSAQCPVVRMSSGDLLAITAWQSIWRANSQFQRFRVSQVFNGFGTTTEGGASTNDALTASTKTLASQFYWVNHTWDHEHLDCFNPVPNSGVCTPATYAESLQEISQNFTLGQQLGLPMDTPSMVTPAISGLNNPNFLAAAKASGIRYLVSDTSKPEYLPAMPNTGQVSSIEPSILLIPRRATNIFYNTYSGFTNATGSLPDEYNYFFGPTGLFKVNGQPFFSTTQTYQNIVNTESDNLLAYMLRYEIYPQMYHQANLVRYSGNRSLFSDVIDAAFTKFSAISNLPVISLDQSVIGKALEDRMAVIKAQVQATLTPGLSITITAPGGSAKVPVTGLCADGCEEYGGQSLSAIPVTPAAPVTVTFGTQCVRAAPTVTFSPSSANVEAGKSVNYTVNVKNNDVACGDSTFNLASTLPTGWTPGVFSVTPLTVAAGATATSILTVATAANTVPATYNISASATNQIGASTGTGTGSCVVTGFFSITGRITLNGTGLSGVTVALSGSTTASKSTDTSGNYSFTGLSQGGTFTVTPSRTGYGFTPANQVVSNLTANQVVNFTAATAPGAPGSPKPASGATGVATSTTLSWSAGSGATSYDVYFGTVNPPVQLVTNTTGTSYVPGALTSNTKYYWKVVAKNAAGSTSSAVWSFTTQNLLPPTAPSGPSPSSLSLSVSLPVTLKWKASTRADSYDVYFGTAFLNPAYVGTVTTTSYVPTGVQTNTVYYWRIVAKNAAGSTSSTIWIFRTKSTPAAPTILFPGNGTMSGTPTAVTLQWGAAAGATSYDVYVGTSTPKYVGATTATNYPLTGLKANTKYYWKVVAKSATGQTSSPTATFTTQ